MKKNKWLSFLSDIQVPQVAYIGLLFVFLIILFFAFRFLTNNFVLLAIVGIIIAALGLFGFFFMKVFKGTEQRKAYAVLTLFLIPFLLTSPYVNAEVVPLDEINSSRTDSEELEKIRLELKEELSIIKADVRLIKDQVALNPAEALGQNEPDILLFVFPIIIVQIINTGVIILFFRNR